MCRQLAFYTSGDRWGRLFPAPSLASAPPSHTPTPPLPLAAPSPTPSGNFDVIVLVFTLVTYYDTATSPWLSSFARGVVRPVHP